MTHKFIQPVSMQVTQAQYEKDLKEPLEKLGYSVQALSLYTSTADLLVTNFEQSPGIVSNVNYCHRHSNNRYFIDHYNPKLFLAIAARTDDPNGIAGEYWKCIKQSIMGAFTIGKLYKANSSIDNPMVFVNNHDRNDGWFPDNELHFTKARLQEIVNQLTTQEIITTMKEEKKIIGYKCPMDLFNGHVKAGDLYIKSTVNKSNSYRHHNKIDTYWAMPLEIVETWEPVYKERLKVGDWVIGWHSDNPKYKNNAWQITKLESSSSKLFAYPNNLDCNTFTSNLRKATPEEIEKASIEIVKITENFQVTIKNKRVFHDTSDITDYVKAVEKFWNDTLKSGLLTLNNYDFTIGDIKINKAGCQSVTHSINDWLNIAAKIK